MLVSSSSLIGKLFCIPVNNYVMNYFTIFSILLNDYFAYSVVIFSNYNWIVSNSASLIYSIGAGLGLLF